MTHKPDNLIIQECKNPDKLEFSYQLIFFGTENFRANYESLEQIARSELDANIHYTKYQEFRHLKKSKKNCETE